MTTNRAKFMSRGLMLAAGGVVALAGAAMVVGAGPGESRGSGQAGKADGKSGNRSSSGLEFYEVNRSDFEITTTSNGELAAKNSVVVHNPLEQETTILEIVPEGTTVKKGQLLVKLNVEQLQKQLDEERLQVESARASVVEADEGYRIQESENDSALRKAKLDVELARLDLEKWREGEVEGKMQSLNDAIKQAEKEEERTREKYEQSQRLEERGFYSKTELQTDELNWERAVSALEKALLDHDTYWCFEYPKDRQTRLSDVEEKAAQLKRTEYQNTSRLTSKLADQKNRKAQLEVRERTLAKLQTQIDSATIMAPQDGLVVYQTSLEGRRWGGGDEGPLQVGSKVWPNRELISLPDTSEMIAAVRVHEALAGRIRKGQPARLKIDALGDGVYSGKVDSVSILAEQSGWWDPSVREYTVKIAIDKGSGSGGSGSGGSGSGGSGGSGGDGSESGVSSEMRPSMRCEAEIILGKVSDVITVPIQSVFSEGLCRYVHIADGGKSGKFTRRPIQVGQRSDRFAEIKVGLAAGERILLRKPEPNEIASKNWNGTELAAVGLEINETGDIVPSAAAIAARTRPVAGADSVKPVVAAEAAAAAVPGETAGGEDEGGGDGGGTNGAEPAAGEAKPAAVESPPAKKG